MRAILWGFIFLALASCNYQRGSGALEIHYSSLSIPYVLGDDSGELTAELAKQLTASTTLSYVNEGGDLVLSVALVEVDQEPIGFRYDHNDEGQPTLRVVADEQRLKAVAEVSLTETATGKVLFGPSRVSAYVDYDLDPDQTQSSQLTLSMGQLDSASAAQDTARRPLYHALAQNILVHITQVW